MLAEFQPESAGIYEANGGRLNNRLVYKHTESNSKF